MGDERDAAALFAREDLIRLDGRVKHAVTSFVGVELPEGWAPASFHLPAGTVAAGDSISVAGVEDPTISGDKRRGLRVVAARVGTRFFDVRRGDESAGGSADSDGSAPTKDDMDWSDV
jgi:hypothetical protein